MTRRLVVWLVAFGISAMLATVVAPAFHPRKFSLDLSHEATASAIVSGGAIVPDGRFIGVIAVYDRGAPLVLSIPIEAAEPYLWRIKLAFQAPGQRVTVRLNGVPQAELVSVKGHDQAEKFRVRTSPGAVKPGANLLQFSHRDPPRSVRYEKVEFANYQAKITPDQAYLVPRALPVPSMHWILTGLWILVMTVAIRAYTAAGRRAVAWAYQRPAARVGWIDWVALTPPVLFAAATAAVPVVSPYRVVLMPAAAGIVVFGSVAIPYPLIAVPAVLHRTLRFLLQLFFKVQLPVRTALVSLLVITARVVWTGLVRATSWLWTVGLPRTGRAVWRWWCRHQNVEGYSRFFVYLLVLAGVLWLLRLRPLATSVGEWAWCALMISVLGHVLRALRSHDEET